MLRQVRFRPKTDDHDIESKIRLVKKLIDEGNKVKVNVIFRGREITHPEIGRELLGRVVKALEGMVTLEKTAALEGRNMTAILAPPPARSRDTKKIAKESKES
jgi:translation initiation factor IF-3